MRTTDGGAAADAARDLGSILHGLRVASGMTQAQVAGMLEMARYPEDDHPRPVHPGTVSGWERGSPLGDFKGETRASTVAQFERLEAEMVRRAGAAGRALPKGYTPGDLARAVTAVIDNRDQKGPSGATAIPLSERGADAGSPLSPPAAAPSLRRRRMLVVAPILTVVLAAGAVLLSVLRGDSPPREDVDVPAAGSTRRPLYQDDFSDPRSGWDDGANDRGSLHYVGGRYQIVLKKTNDGMFGSRIWADLPPNVRVEVDATKVTPALGSFGLACRDDNGRRYEARVDINHRWRIAREGRNLSSGSSDLIHADGTNQLGLECRGGGGSHTTVNLDLYVNGVRVGGATDGDGLGPGGIGVVVASGTEEVQVLFDNFAVRAI